MLLVTLTVFLIGLFIWYVKRRQEYFKRNNVPYEEPTFFFGNLLPMLMGRKNLAEIVEEIYRKNSSAHKYVGFYKFLSPLIIVNDPELVGEIMMKNFHSFGDNDVYVDEDVDFIMAKNLFVLKGQKWKTMKALLSPMFTSNKFRTVYPMMLEVGDRFVNYVSREIESGRGDCIEGKPLCLKFTTENVANCVYGVEARTFEPGEESEFVKVARDFGDPSYINGLKFLLGLMMPSLNKYLGVKFFSDYAQSYLSSIVSQTLQYRRENNIVRPDFLHMISSMQEKSTEYKIEERDVIAQASGFFFDGVETSAGTLSYIFYELAANPEVQQKLREKILQLLDENDNKFPYEALNELEYLECIIHESLRKNPIAMVIFKTCTKEFDLPPAKEGSGKGLTVKPGDPFIIPIEGLHHNPEHYPDPHKFIPERFLSENKDNLVKHTYLGFGEGPRLCIGIRFALIQIKIAVAAVISKFSIEVHEKTEEPLSINPGAFLRQPKKGFWFKFKKVD